MVRTPSCDKSGMRKGTWTTEEDKKLIAYVTRYGCWNWRQLPKFAGLQRCGKSCRLRWLNYLRPNIKRGNFTKEEEEIIIRLHNKLGNRWSIIATHLLGRTDNEIKNYWHTSLKKISQQTKVTNENSKASSKPKDNESNLGSYSLPNNVSLQVTPPTTTSQISDSITSSLSPLSSSSEFSSISWGDTNCTTKLVIEDDFPFLDDAFWTKSDIVDISYTPPSEIVQGDSNDAFESLYTTQNLAALSPQYQSSSESMVLESGSFLDADTEVKMDNFWTQPFVSDTCQVPNQLLTPFETQSQYFSSVHGADFWNQDDNDCYLYDGVMDLV
ncbi:hypothetical protein TanjilG_03079 [Lupinus angustifolius]|uniref:Uncharacterized protein n=1 Tax=Lupinus angustifolius TaxID=3871 RepID=A0A4P1RD12_LUPAN|nr:PREDICTED: myb-related protein Myb4-like [Lupinus angustifolius]OIW08403.1 hypothetical protein TanjilG_03079 [Lupinus angustifolius]